MVRHGGVLTPPLNADQQKIIDRLTRGPLLCTAYRGLAPSAGALKVSIHRLRKRGVDIKTVQVICGHEQIETTLLYVHVLGDGIKEVARRFSIHQGVHNSSLN